MTLLDIKFNPFVPSTIIGLLALITGYVYFYYKNRNDNRLKEIQSIPSNDRLRAIEVYLNELGVSVDTKNLTPTDKLKLLQSSLRTKTIKYLILAITTIILGSYITFLVWSEITTRMRVVSSPAKTDTLSLKAADSSKQNMGKQDNDKVTKANTQDEELQKRKSEFHFQILAIKKEAQFNKELLENSIRKSIDSEMVLFNDFAIHAVAQYGDNSLFSEFATDKEIATLRRYLENLKLSNQYRVKANSFLELSAGIERVNRRNAHTAVINAWQNSLDIISTEIKEIVKFNY